MASAPKDIEVKVNVESVIHNEIRESMQYISERHGINVNSIDISWSDVSEQGRKSFVIDMISLNTTSTS